MAVITGPSTASAGEAVAVAFNGRVRTRRFGQPTAGVPTAVATFPLSDGAGLALMVAHDIDRNATDFNAALIPDQPIPDSTTGANTADSAAVAAANWLLATPACTTG